MVVLFLKSRSVWGEVLKRKLMNYFEIIQDMVYCFHDKKQKWNIEMRLIRSSPSPFLRGHHCYQLGVCPFRPCFVYLHIYSEKVDCITFYISNLHIAYSISLDFFSSYNWHFRSFDKSVHMKLLHYFWLLHSIPQHRVARCAHWWILSFVPNFLF